MTLISALVEASKHRTFNRSTCQVITKVTTSSAAARAICESLLPTLTDLNIVSAQDVRGLLSDVVETHSAAALASECPEHD